jgi:hypothetical protein
MLNHQVYLDEEILSGEIKSNRRRTLKPTKANPCGGNRWDKFPIINDFNYLYICHFDNWYF